MSSRTSGGMLSALTSRVGNLALRQNVSYRVALEETIRTIFRSFGEGNVLGKWQMRSIGQSWRKNPGKTCLITRLK
jgi:hypothetical protein